MLSLLPQLFFLTPLCFTLLRGVLAALIAVGIIESWPDSRGVLSRLLIGIEGVIVIGLAFGIWTQAAAIAALLLFALWLALPKARPYPLSTILLAGAIALTVLVGGAGFFAFDLPL
ncbi:MAG TPA: hypothetical protein VFL98_03635 [Candidatus Paceibacterota bacterium]|nr:hypothetical protein [Candidatus Paceibacterota bacterium]